MTNPITPPPVNTSIDSPLWKQAIIALYNATTKGFGVAPTAVSAGSSPTTYTNINLYPVDFVINGGTVTSISFKRYINQVATPVVAFPTTTSMIALSPGDSITLAWTAAPTLTVIPR